MKIYLGSSVTDLYYLRALRDRLYAMDVEPFLYDEVIRTDDVWNTSVKQKLSEADIFVPYCSSDYFSNEWCKNEVEYAYSLYKDSNIKILPITSVSKVLQPPLNEFESYSKSDYAIDDIAKIIIKQGKQKPSQTTIKDIFSVYEIAFQNLADNIEKENPSYTEFLIYQQRFLENISLTKLYGDNETRKTERAEIINRINGISKSISGKTFNDICRRVEKSINGNKPVQPKEQGKIRLSPSLFVNHDAVGLIGTGGFADVYSGVKVSTGKIEAIKVLRSVLRHIPEYQRRFFRGAEQQQKLKHKNIADVFEIDYRNGLYTMEYMDWGDLGRWMSIKKLKTDEIIELFNNICDAVAFAHDNGVLHRDIKPGNILLNHAGEVKLTDFDLAYFQEMTGYTRTGAALGSLPFIAPELLSDSRNCTRQSDIYGVGVVLYYLLTGKASLLATMDKQDILEELEEVGRESFIDCVMGAIDRKPFKRFPDIRKLKEAINSISRSTPQRIYTPNTKAQLNKKTLSLLENNQIWSKATIEDQDDAIHNVASVVEAELALIGIYNQKCNGITNRIAEFQCKLTGIILNLIPGSIYQMGVSDIEGEYSYCQSIYPDWQRKWNDREIPAHNVKIPPFFAAKYSVRQLEWDRFKEYLGLRDKRKFIGENNPIDQVSWDDIQPFLKEFNFRLFSEAEWEYACRAGSSTRFFWGNEFDETYCWYSGNAQNSSQSVLLHENKSNAFGLVDMLGNIWDWCEDDWHDDYSGAPIDNIPWKMGKPRHSVQRGGAWNNHPPGCRSTFRSSWAREDRLDNTGFRVAKSLIKSNKDLE